MSITLVQSNVQHNVGQTSVKTTFNNPVTAGNVIGIAIMTNAVSSNAPTSVVDTNGDTLLTALSWTKPATGEGAVGIYLFVVGTGGSSFGITPTFAASTTWSAFVFEYAGVNTTTPQDGSASTVGAGSGTSATCGNLTPAQVGDQQLAFIWTASSTAVTWGNSLNQEQTQTSGTPKAFFADLTLTSTATAAASGTLSPGGGWNMAQILLQPAVVNYAFVQDSAACTTSVVSSLSTPAITVTAGHFLIAATWSNGQSISTVTDTLGNTYSSIDNAGSLYVYVCPNTLGGSNAVTFTYAGSSNVQVYLAEYSGLGGTLGAVLAHSNVSNHSGTAFTGGPVNASSVPAMIWAMCVDSSNQATAPLNTGNMTPRTTALWTCNTPFNQDAVGDYQVNTGGNANSNFILGNQFDTARIVTMAIATTAATPQSPPLSALFNRRQQLYFLP